MSGAISQRSSRPAAHRCLKAIIETCLLTDEEKVQACLLAKEAGADFVKTSTGYGGGGATVEDVALMRRTVGPTMGVKASGGIAHLRPGAGDGAGRSYADRREFRSRNGDGDNTGLTTC